MTVKDREKLAAWYALRKIRNEGYQPGEAVLLAQLSYGLTGAGVRRVRKTVEEQTK